MVTEEGVVDETNEHGFSALIWASLKGHVAVVEVLLEHAEQAGVVLNPPPLQHTPVRGASNNGHAVVVRALLAAGADVNIPSMGNRTAAMGAAMNGHVEILNALIDAGADLRVVNDFGETAADLAAAKGHARPSRLPEKFAANCGAARTVAMANIWHVSRTNCM